MLLLYFLTVSEARLRSKIRKINEALEEDPVDVQTLRNLAISQDGLITNDLRRRVWPKLLNVNVFDEPISTKNKKGMTLYCYLLSLSTVLFVVVDFD